MADDLTQDSVLRATVEALSRAYGYEFAAERLAAVLPEVRRLREMLRQLRALPLDDEDPAVRLDLP